MMKWTINILIMISLFFTGCSKSMTTVNFREISIEPKFSIQHKEKIQAGIGLFLPQRFRDYNYQIEQHGIGKLANYEGNISIGRNTSLAFYQMMSSIFSHVVILEEYNRQIKLSDPDISFVAVPGIELFDFKVPRTGLSDYKVRLGLGCTFYDRNGALVVSIVKTAEKNIGAFSAVSKEGGLHGAVTTLVQDAFEDAINQIAHQIMEDRSKFSINVAGGH